MVRYYVPDMFLIHYRIYNDYSKIHINNYCLKPELLVILLH